MPSNIKPCDVFLTRGHGLLSKAVRLFSRGIGESRTKVNHVGVVVDEGTLKTCIVVEALIKVCQHKLWDRYGPPRKDFVAIYRPLNISEEEMATIIAEASEQVGKNFGFLKIAAHFLDWCLMGAYVFRRLTKDGDYPICSWVVAHAFSKAGKHFDVEPDAAQPDDIWDFVQANTDKYEEVHPLKRIWD